MFRKNTLTDKDNSIFQNDESEEELQAQIKNKKFFKD